MLSGLPLSLIQQRWKLDQISCPFTEKPETEHKDDQFLEEGEGEDVDIGTEDLNFIDNLVFQNVELEDEHI